MLMSNNCTSISSVKVELVFDDRSKKIRVLSIGDLVDVIYNGNGVRKRILGTVAAVSTVGVDPKNWYIIIDGSDDFDAQQARFAPTAILDCEILRKGDEDESVKTPRGEFSARFIRVNHGRLQYSKDGYSWQDIVVDSENVISNDYPPYPGDEDHSEDPDA